MNAALVEYLIITTAGSAFLFYLAVNRIIHPFHCTCGYTTFFARSMFRHLQTGHKYHEPERKD